MDSGIIPWLVVRTFNRQELIVSEFLKSEGLTCFIPMHYVERDGHGEKAKRQLMPVIHNYVFIEKTLPLETLTTIMTRCSVPIYLLKAHDGNHPAEISNREMVEFRMLCDPAFDQTTEIGEDDAETELGKEVEIVHGPFKGVCGRLYRKRKQYWFVKTIAGISVRFHITRWYCRQITEIKRNEQ